MKKKLVVLGLCGLLMVTGCGQKQIPKLEDGKEVVAEVEGKQITADDLYSALKEESGTNVLINLIDEFIISKEFTDEDAANSYADRQYKYLKAQYEAKGTDFDKYVLQYYDSIKDFKNMIAKDYKATKVAENYVKSILTEDEIKKYYEDEIFGTMTVRHILIIPSYEKDASEDDIKKAKEEALEKAKNLINELNNGADFETLAKENSQDGTASNGGLFENFSKENTDSAFWAASYKLEDGKYTTEPVESQYGYHIIYKVSGNEKPSLEDSRDKITAALANQKLNESSNSVQIYLAKVREKYKLHIYETTINDLYNKTIDKLK